MKKKSNIAQAVEETLRGLPDKITVYVPFDRDLEEPSTWEESDIQYNFPCAYLTMRACEREIASDTVSILEAFLEGDIDNLPSFIDEPLKCVLHRTGKLEADPSGFHRSMDLYNLVSDHSGVRVDQKTFNREFAHYYAGLVAQQRNNK